MDMSKQLVLGYLLHGFNESLSAVKLSNLIRHVFGSMLEINASLAIAFRNSGLEICSCVMSLAMGAHRRWMTRP